MYSDGKRHGRNLQLPEEVHYKTGTRRSSGRIRDGKFLYYIPKQMKPEAVERVLATLRPQLQKRLEDALCHADYFVHTPSTVTGADGLRKMAEEIYTRKYRRIDFPLTIKFRRQKTVMGTYRRKGDGPVTVHINDYFQAAPSILLEYIIAHELSHHRCPGHDRAFYRELAELCPDYLAKRKLANEFLLLREAKFL